MLKKLKLKLKHVLHSDTQAQGRQALKLNLNLKHVLHVLHGDEAAAHSSSSPKPKPKLKHVLHGDTQAQRSSQGIAQAQAQARAARAAR